MTGNELRRSTQQQPDGGVPSNAAPGGRRERLFLLLIIVVGAALHLPTINMGFLSDEYAHQFVLRGVVEHETLRPWSLYDWGAFPGRDSLSWQSGGFPWWTHPEWKIRFFRPLSSISLWLDHALFGDWAAGYHLTSLVWYVGLLFLLYGLYRSFELPVSTSLLALLLFALGDSCIFPVAWSANRNSLLAVFFTVASMLVLTRHRVWGRGLALAGAMILAGLACLAKESGVAALALIAVYLLLLRRKEGTPATRRWALTGAAASLLIGVLYLVVLFTAGYGTNCAFYTMPLGQTGEFLERLGILLSFGALSLVGPFSLDLLLLIPEATVPAVLVAVAVTLPLGWVVWKHAKPFSGAYLFAAWILLTIIPQAGAPVSDRLLFAPTVGSSALLALFVSAALSGNSARPRSRLPRILAYVVLSTAGLLSGVSILAGGFVLSDLATEVRETVLRADVGPAELGRREVFLLQSPNALVAFAAVSTWAIESEDHDVRFWPMQTGRRGVRLTRVDERTFELETLDRPFLTDLFERVFLATRTPPAPGTRWETALFSVEAVETSADGLRRFRVRCEDSLDSPRYRFLMVKDGGLVATAPPAVGESVEYAAVVPPHPFTL